MSIVYNVMDMYVPLLSDLGRSSEMHHFVAMLCHQSKGTIEVVGNVHEQFLCVKCTLSQVCVLTEHVQ